MYSLKYTNAIHLLVLLSVTLGNLTLVNASKLLRSTHYFLNEGGTDHAVQAQRRRTQSTGPLGVFAVGDSVLVDADEPACIASIVDANQGIVAINYADGVTFGEQIGVDSLTLVQAGVGCTEVPENGGENPEEEIDDEEEEEDFDFENPSGETPAFPPLNQQCQDDAGPRWEEDLQRFGPDKFYWSESHARAVLNQDGSCPNPVEEACQTRKNPLQAFIEGPISCPDAWACRIYPDPNHGAGYDFLGDRNFGNCDRPDSDLWEDTMTDQDGHCHGGLDPSSYYWWVRDHWNRPYSGRVKCCCVDSKEIGTTGRRTMNLDGIANRCDYRAKVTVDVNECRDANEDHDGGRMGSGFLYGYDGPGGFGESEGCPRTADGKVAYTREPVDEMCWEILNFGLPDVNDNDATISESSTGPCTGAGSATGGSCLGVEAFPGQFSGPDAPQYVRPAIAGPFTPMPTLSSNTDLPESTSGPTDSDSTSSTQTATGEVDLERPQSESGSLVKSFTLALWLFFSLF